MSSCERNRARKRETRLIKEKVWKTEKQRERKNLFSPTNDAVLLHSQSTTCMFPRTCNKCTPAVVNYTNTPSFFQIGLVLSAILLETQAWTNKHCVELIGISRKKHNSPQFPQNWIGGVWEITSDKDADKRTKSSLHFIGGTKMCGILNSLYRQEMWSLSESIVTQHGLGV